MQVFFAGKRNRPRTVSPGPGVDPGFRRGDDFCENDGCGLDAGFCEDDGYREKMGYLLGWGVMRR